MEIELKQIQGKVIQIYPESFKRKVIEEYLRTGVTKMALLRKYGIKTKSGIQRWMKRLGYTDVCIPHRFNFGKLILTPLSEATKTTDVGELQKKIKELEQQLQDEKLRSEAYERIIEKAEKELKIRIRKKLDTR
jgi:transposase